MKLIKSLLFLLFFVMSSYGQTPKLIAKNNTDKNTNASQNIHCSLMDKAGNIWFGTTGDGVYRFDGKLFINFITKDGLSDNCVWSVLEDKVGNIWFGTKAGVCRYDGKTITKIPIGMSINTAYSMLQSQNGIIWFGTENGVYCYNGKSFSHFLENDSVINKNGLRLKLVERMLEDKKGNIWFSSGMGGGEAVCRYDGKSIVSFKPNGDVWVPNMLEDQKGNIWFSGRSHGYFRYDGKTFTDFTEEVGFSPTIGNNAGNICLKGKAGFGPMLEDKFGNIWFTGKMIRFGGEGGIWRYDGKSCANITTKDGFGDYVVWCMIEDKVGNIWLGTNNTGLYRFDGKTFTEFSEKWSK
jgi:streptogramin lyase